mmetsp:Transcript_57009/g.129167  ORF Transcript_57009/g.129167 Transcript_57009/m.129167 type:complete len:340 (-) Transcript_57009:147-1166(-)
MVILRCYEKRSGTVLLRLVNLGAPLEQRLDDLEVAILRPDKERRDSFLVRLIDLKPGLEVCIYLGEITRPCSQNQFGAVILVTLAPPGIERGVTRAQDRCFNKVRHLGGEGLQHLVRDAESGITSKESCERWRRRRLVPDLPQRNLEAGASSAELRGFAHRRRRRQRCPPVLGLLGDGGLENAEVIAVLGKSRELYRLGLRDSLQNTRLPRRKRGANVLEALQDAFPLPLAVLREGKGRGFGSLHRRRQICQLEIRDGAHRCQGLPCFPVLEGAKPMHGRRPHAPVNLRHGLAHDLVAVQAHRHCRVLRRANRACVSATRRPLIFFCRPRSLLCRSLRC